MAREIATRPFEAFAGQYVCVALNLNLCGKGKSVTPGVTACWTLREKPVSSSPVLAVTSYVLLKDVTFVVNESKLRAVQKRGTKEVFAFACGTAVAQRGANVPTHMKSVQFRPLPPWNDETFKIVTGERRAAVHELAWFFGEGIKAVGNSARGNGHGIFVESLAIAADAPDFYGSSD